jgi:hypothetical protein
MKSNGNMKKLQLMNFGDVQNVNKYIGKEGNFKEQNKNMPILKNDILFKV